jgi:regulator of nonsense transcripts 2
MIVFQTLRPKLVFVKSFEEAASAVDEMFEAIRPGAEDSGDDSGDDDDERVKPEEEDGMEVSEPVSR